MPINVLAELDRAQIAVQWVGAEEVRICCPFHEDSSPSCCVNTAKEVFECKTAGCGAHGDIISLLARHYKVSRTTVVADLATRYDIEEVKRVDIDYVERCHSRIWQSGQLIAELRKRAITDESIRRWRLGIDNTRITIPIPNEQGTYVNVRKYLPGAPGKDKMRNLRGYGGTTVFPISQLEYAEILVTGGECKAIAAAQELNQYRIGAITLTSGENANWPTHLINRLHGKRIWVCVDIDEAGKASAEAHCRQIAPIADWIGRVDLPLDPVTFPKGDINDYLAAGKLLKPLLDDCPQWTPSGEAAVTLEEIEVSLTEATTASNANRPLKVKAVVSAVDTAPYAIPSTVYANCGRDQKFCGACRIYGDVTKATFDVPATGQQVLEMLGAKKAVQHEVLAKLGGIPSICRAVQFEPKAFYNVEDCRISPQLEITRRNNDRVMVPAYLIGTQAELNECYVLHGRCLPHPQTQQVALLIDQYEPAQDALSSYVLESPEELEIFRPLGDSLQALTERIDDIYKDFSANVTRIFDRPLLHLAVDLAYHSPLLLTFDGRTVKGWTEVLILGDSAQGKSETALRIRDHYGLGEKVECKNASIAGLLGGLQQLGSRWFVSWGVIPTHDQRLVILEEVKGASTHIIGKLTDMRSSGVAEIPKIEKRRTNARTRLLALSNPRSDKPLAAHNFGVEAIRELIGGLEDIRRFDFCLLVAASEVSPDRLNTLQASRPEVKHLYTSELCRKLVLWAWTRQEDAVVFESAAEAEVLAAATRLSEKFTDELPLIDRGSARYKVARLAAAVAARVFSSNVSYSTLIVKKVHVQYVEQLLQTVYSGSTMGYADFTEAVRLSASLVDAEKIQKAILSTPFPADFIKQLLHTSEIELQDLCDFNGWDRSEAQNLLSVLVRKHALTRDGRVYRKTPPFIELLRRLLKSDEVNNRPDYIPEF